MAETIADEVPAGLDPSKGGRARAEALTPEEREEIARKAAQARWEVPQAIREGELRIGDVVISCAVLDDAQDCKSNTRVLTQRGVYVALGRHKNPTKGQSTIDDRPAFVAAKNLEPFINEELRRSWTPIKFRLKGRSGGYGGNVAFGYPAEILPAVCRVFMDADAEGELLASQKHIAARCRMLLTGFATVGIIALVDEATNFQEIRDRVALQEILDRYLLKAEAEWAKRFPDDFYKEIFRLRDWQWKGMKVNRPQCVAHYTKDLVYARLAPGLLKELEVRNPKDERGVRKAKHHQWFTEDIGHPKLQQHLTAVITLMRAFDKWEEFKQRLDRALPRQMAMPLLDWAENQNEEG